MSAFRRYNAESDYWLEKERKKEEEKERMSEEKKNYNSIDFNTLSNMEAAITIQDELDYNNLFKFKIFAFFVFVIFTLTVSGTIYTYAVNKKTNITTSSSLNEILQDDINVTVSNEYGIYKGAKYGWLTNKYLAEPHKTTILSVNNNENDTVLWQWKQENITDLLWGKTVEKIFTNTGEYNMYLNGLNSKNETIVSKIIPIIVKYVKRELRS